MPTLDEARTWVGADMVDADGDKVGSIDEIYLDRDTGEPEWATVRTGLFGAKASFVPIREAQRSGDEVRVPFQKEQVKDAPRIDPDGELSPEEERRLYEHYGRSDYDQWQGEDRTTSLGLPEEPEGRFARTPESDISAAGAAEGGETPPIVAVRLRRVVVLTGGRDEPGEPGAPGAPGAGPDRP